MIPYLSEEQLALRGEVRKFLRDRAPIAGVRAAMVTDLGYDPDAWRQLGEQLGLVALAVDTVHGGAGPAFVELAIVLEELGYACVAGPYLSTVLAAGALESGGPLTSDVCADLLAELAAGAVTATFCVADDGGSWRADTGTAHASVGPDGEWTISGYSAFVVDGGTADQLVVVATAAERAGLFVVDRRAPGVVCAPCPMLDQTRRVARITYERTPAMLVSLDAEDAIARVLNIASVLLAAESLGGARACLDMAVQYAKDREQFGRPIGSFQAIKFTCADMLVKVESATSAVFYASRLIGTADEDELAGVASLAKAYCSDAFFEVAASNIQVHGGIGFTWEHDAHLYFKRATCSRLLFGDPDRHRELMLDSVGI